uniref:Uncharacterized protein n=1 Tax=viral metagenome TaxID=1070528 RepID=A0A6C0AP02_9ZZZZ
MSSTGGTSEGPSDLETWLEDMRSDIDPDTGYIVANPKTLYGQQIKTLTNYVCSQSAEVNAIKHSRRIRSSRFCVYMFHVLQFLATYVLPITSAATVGYLYYTTEYDPILPPIVPVTNSTFYFPSVAETGVFLGSSIQWIASAPFSLVGNTLNSALNLTYIYDKVVYTPIIMTVTYFATFLILRLLLNLQTIWSTEQKLWNYQELILQETHQVIERAITKIVQPSVLYYSQNPSRRLTLHESLSVHIKKLPFYWLLRHGSVSPQYMKGVYNLIKSADDELSEIMFHMVEEMNRAPGRLTNGIRRTAGQTASVLTALRSQIF